MNTFDILRLPAPDDARVLFPYLVDTSVVQNIAWDGPASEQEYISSWAEVVEDVRCKKKHFFVILHPESREPIGSCDVRPDEEHYRASLGLWIGEPHQRRGMGTRAIAELVSYAFKDLGIHKLDAEIFVGNWASRKAFENNGFILEGTIRAATLKAGIPRDGWHLGLINQSTRFRTLD